MRNQILNVKSLMFLFTIILLTCGMSDISYAQVCNVGDILSPGESCIDPGSGSTFSVLADGRGQILFITSGGNITLRAVLNGVQYNFVASKQADGSWKIEAVTPGDTTPTVPSTVDNPEDMSIPYQTLSGHTAAVWQVAYSPDGSTLASGSGDKTVRLWDAHTGEHKQTLRHTNTVTSVAYSPDGNTLASGDLNQIIGFWAAATGELIAGTQALGASILSLNYSPDSSRIAVGAGRDIALIDPPNNTEDDIVLEKVLTGHTDAVWSVAYSPDGSTLASGSADRTIRLWDAHTGEHKQTISGHTDTVWSVVYSPDGSTLASGSGDKTIRLWDAHTGEHKQTISGHTEVVWSVAYSPDGSTLASGSGDKTIRLWNAHTGEHKQTISGHTDSVWSVAYSPDGSTLASGNADKTIRLYKILVQPPTQKPDLVVERPTVSKSTLTPSENFTLSATVTNEGVGGAAATTLRYYRSTDTIISTSDTEVGTDSVSELGADESSAESISLTAPMSPGTYYYGACVDSITDESQSGNNCSASVSITVERVNLVLSASTTAPLTESNLDGSVVTLTLSGGTFHPPFNGLIHGQPINSVLGVKVSGIPGVTIPSERVLGGAVVIVGGVPQLAIRYAIDRISDTELAVELAYDGTDFGTDATLTFTVEARAIAGYSVFDSDGPELTAQVSVTAITAIEFNLSIPAGISLIHVPLRVTEVDGREQTIKSISELYDALGGTSTVNFLITRDSQNQEWHSYFVPSDKGGPADRVLTDDIGIIVGLRAPVSVQLTGDALGTNGNSAINLSPGLNVVGLPLNNPDLTRVSDLLMLDGIRGNVPVIILTDGGEFKLVGRAGDPGDIEITGGQAFIMTASRAATVAISGDAWANSSGTAAPPIALKGIEVGNTTPVLGLRGSVVDEGTGLNNTNFRVTVKNLSTGRAVATVTTPDEAGYRSTVVDIEAGRAATVGDVLEISAQSPNRFIGVEPLLYTVTAEDVKQSLIQLPNLFAYEIPAETQLLSNYPNPFNPETWIPYRLAEDAFVILTIYDLNGQAVRTIDVGHQTAAIYESRSKAVYWDGRNGLGEQVASGVYFYHLSAGDYSATRKMLILK